MLSRVTHAREEYTVRIGTNYDDDDILNMMEFAVSMGVGTTHELYVKTYNASISVQQGYDYTDEYPEFKYQVDLAITCVDNDVDEKEMELEGAEEEDNDEEEDVGEVGHSSGGSFVNQIMLGPPQCLYPLVVGGDMSIAELMAQFLS